MWRSLKYYSIVILNLQLRRLTDDQAFTLEAALSGHNVFITGQAGTGKSFLGKKFFSNLNKAAKMWPLSPPLEFQEHFTNI